MEIANWALLSFEQYGPISGENLPLLSICSYSPSNKTVETEGLSFKWSSSSYELHFFSVPSQKKKKFGVPLLLGSSNSSDLTVNFSYFYTKIF